MRRIGRDTTGRSEASFARAARLFPPPVMCLARALPVPLTSVEETAAMAAAEAAVEPAELWARAFAAVEADLRALVQAARAVGLDDEDVEEAEDAIRAPVGDTELSRLRGLQFRESSAQELAGLLRAAGHRSALIAEWAEDMEVNRRVRPRLA